MPIPLVERSDKEMARSIRKRIGSLEEVAECKEVTIGFTRKKPNIHFHVVLKGNPDFEETHITCSKIDREVRDLVANARVVIHSEPTDTRDTDEVWMLVKKMADNEPGSRGVQNIHLKRIEESLGVDLKLQMSDTMAGDQPSQIELRLGQNLKVADSRISEVVVHRDSVSHLIFSEQWGHGTELASYVDHLAKRFPELVWVGPLTSRRTTDGLHLVERVAFRPYTSADEIARISSQLEVALKNAYPEIVRVEVVEEREPAGGP